MENVLNPYLNSQSQITWLPTIPKNYGVSSKPFTKIAILSSILILGSTTLTALAIVFQWIIIGIVGALAVVASLSLLGIVYKIHRNNITNIYRTKYLKEIFDIWFQTNYSLKLHLDDLNLLTRGIPIMLGEDSYLGIREADKGKTYVSLLPIGQLKESQTSNLILPVSPRVNLQTKAERTVNYRVPENFGYTIVEVDGKIIALPLTAK